MSNSHDFNNDQNNYISHRVALLCKADVESRSFLTFHYFLHCNLSTCVDYSKWSPAFFFFFFFLIQVTLTIWKSTLLTAVTSVVRCRGISQVSRLSVCQQWCTAAGVPPALLTLQLFCRHLHNKFQQYQLFRLFN